MEIHVDGDGFVSVAELPDRPLRRRGDPARRARALRIPDHGLDHRGRDRPDRSLPGQVGGARGDRARRSSRGPRSRSRATATAILSTGCAPGAAPRRPDRDADADDDPRDGDRLADPGLRLLARARDRRFDRLHQQPARADREDRRGSSSGAATRFRPTRPSSERRRSRSRTSTATTPRSPARARRCPRSRRSCVRSGGARRSTRPPRTKTCTRTCGAGPFYGFRRVIDYFRFTDSPRRLKPIGIYYHFYSGTKAAAIKALHDVYAWAREQETFPVWASEYAAAVRGFEEASLARRLDGRWLFRDLGALSHRAVARGARLAGSRQVGRRRRRARPSPGTLRSARGREESDLWFCPPPPRAGPIFWRPMPLSRPSNAPTAASLCTFAGTCPSRRRLADAPTRFRSTAFRLPALRSERHPTRGRPGQFR